MKTKPSYAHFTHVRIKSLHETRPLVLSKYQSDERAMTLKEIVLWQRSTHCYHSKLLGDSSKIFVLYKHHLSCSCITPHSLLNQSSQNSHTLSKSPLVDQKQATHTLEAFEVVLKFNHIKPRLGLLCSPPSLLDISPPLRCCKHTQSLILDACIQSHVPFLSHKYDIYI